MGPAAQPAQGGEAAVDGGRAAAGGEQLLAIGDQIVRAQTVKRKAAGLAGVPGEEMAQVVSVAAAGCGRDADAGQLGKEGAEPIGIGRRRRPYCTQCYPPR